MLPVAVVNGVLMPPCTVVTVKVFELGIEVMKYEIPVTIPPNVTPENFTFAPTCNGKVPAQVIMLP